MEHKLFYPNKELSANAAIKSMDEYNKLQDFAKNDYEGFWDSFAKDKITWKKPYTKALDESNVDAAKRRLADELGMSAAHIEEVSPYRYTFVRDGVMENEICPIIIGKTDVEPNPNPDEVEATKWVPWEAFVREIEGHPERYSEWCVEEVAILKRNEKLKKLLET